MFATDAEAYGRRILAALSDFLLAPDAAAMRAVVLNEPLLLTRGSAGRILRDVAESQRPEADENIMRLYEKSIELLDFCRVIGVDLAFHWLVEGGEAGPDERELFAAVLALVRASSWAQVGDLIRQRAPLRDAGADAVLARLATAHPTIEPLPAHALLAQCRQFLAWCRDNGVTEALAAAEAGRAVLSMIDAGPSTPALFEAATASDDGFPALVEQYPNLVSDDFDHRLALTINELNGRDERSLERLLRTRFLLIRCQEVPPPVALAEVGDTIGEPPAHPLNDVFLTLPPPVGDAFDRAVADHPELLSFEADLRLGFHAAGCARSSTATTRRRSSRPCAGRSPSSASGPPALSRPTQGWPMPPRPGRRTTRTPCRSSSAPGTGRRPIGSRGAPRAPRRRGRCAARR